MEWQKIENKVITITKKYQNNNIIQNFKDIDDVSLDELFEVSIN